MEKTISLLVLIIIFTGLISFAILESNEEQADNAHKVKSIIKVQDDTEK